MLNIRIENNEGTYRYYVFVNGKEIERGDYSGHNREDGWAALVLDITLRHLTPRALDSAPPYTAEELDIITDPRRNGALQSPPSQ